MSLLIESEVASILQELDFLSLFFNKRITRHSNRALSTGRNAEYQPEETVQTPSASDGNPSENWRVAAITYYTVLRPRKTVWSGLPLEAINHKGTLNPFSEWRPVP